MRNLDIAGNDCSGGGAVVGGSNTIKSMFGGGGKTVSIAMDAIKHHHSPSSPSSTKAPVVFAKLVWVRIEFCGIGDIDTVNEKYQAEVKIKSKWYDEGDIEEYDKKKHWYPKLFIENALDNVKEEITYDITKVDDKCMIVETRIAKGNFKMLPM